MAKVTYIGSTEPANDADFMDQFGLSFVKHEAIELSDTALLDRIRGNPFYVIEENAADGIADGDAASGGSPSPRRRGGRRSRKLAD